MARQADLDLIGSGVEHWNTWRQKNPEVKPDLSSAKLSCANLSEVDLRSVNLQGVDFRRTILSDADLSEANLSLADLSKADLRNAHLTNATLCKTKLIEASLGGADLTNTDLTGAILYRSDVTRANLNGTKFNQARFYKTVLADVNLMKAVGLEACYHLGPSEIGYRTLADSQGVPAKFWRGCGLSDALVDYLPAMTDKAIEFYSCFISYSHADKSFAQRLHDGLQGQGIRCWLDDHQMQPGDVIFDAIDRGIRLWDKVVLCCSEASLSSAWVNREIDKALRKEEQVWKERGNEVLALIPLNLDDALFDWKSGKASELTRRLAADFTGWERDNAKFEAQFQQLIKALRADDLAREQPPTSKL